MSDVLVVMRWLVLLSMFRGVAVLIDPLAEQSRRLTAAAPRLRSVDWSGTHVLPASKQRGISKSSVAQDPGLHVGDLESWSSD